MPAWAGSLKLRQRDDALARGLDLIEWTFDPLELKNAYFNMERLGAIVRRYVRNQYGVSSSPLHGRASDGSLRGGVVDSETARNQGAKSCERISSPWRISVSARAMQSEIADQFERCFARGLAVIGMEGGAFVFVRGAWIEDRADRAAAASDAAGAFLRDQLQPDV